MSSVPEWVAGDDCMDCSLTENCVLLGRETHFCSGRRDTGAGGQGNFQNT